MIKYLLLFLFSLNAFASTGSSGNNSNVVSVGGGSIAVSNSSVLTLSPALTIPEGNVGKYKTLIANAAQGASTDFYYHFVDSASSSQYQVPNGKNFYIVQMCAQTNSISYQFSFNIGTSSATFTDNSATVPTSPIYFGHGASARYVFFVPTSGGNAAPAQSTTVPSCWNLPFKISQNLYPFLHNYIGAGTVFLVGKEDI